MQHFSITVPHCGDKCKEQDFSVLAPLRPIASGSGIRVGNWIMLISALEKFV